MSRFDIHHTLVHPWIDLKGIASAMRLEAEYQMAQWPTAGPLESRYEWYYRTYMMETK